MLHGHKRQRYSVNRTTDPVQDPVALADVKLALGETGTDNDAAITLMITAATRAAERFTRRTFITSTYEMFLDHYPGQRLPWWDGVRQGADTELTELTGDIEIPFPPLISISGIRSFPDGDDLGKLIPMADFFVDTSSTPGRAVINRTKSWPSDILRIVNGVKIVYIAGYGTARTDVPSDIRQAITFWVSDMFKSQGSEAFKKEKVGESEYERFPESTMPAAARNLLSGYKVWSL